ncbi:hypothetical protein B0H16DRAFT_1731625 [Mycena metata]|uniref:Uncharacterized protein n=1 Tax=Mycena metata TaxID=1033252 RepID=A0AAD7I4H3_9AGAR|nr:hypothetical protein B0H16DRAFT_1731625 [Mycena metata]
MTMASFPLVDGAVPLTPSPPPSICTAAISASKPFRRPSATSPRAARPLAAALCIPTAPWAAPAALRCCCSPASAGTAGAPTPGARGARDHP